VKQQFKGELKEINGKAKRWKDEIHIGITSDSKISAEKVRALIPEGATPKGVFITDYMDLPWEIEAYAMQETLLEEYKNA
jgi:hypothetical protein